MAVGRAFTTVSFPVLPTCQTMPQRIARRRIEREQKEEVNITSQQRKQARISRDKERKAAKHAALYERCGKIENVMTLQNTFRSLLRRIQGTIWKGSVQNYVAHFVVKNNRARRAVLEGKMAPSFKVRRMTLSERGKRRDIQMVDIESRVVQGVLCDSSLTPILEPTLIYDNPASIKGKGVSAARRRLECFLQREVRQYGSDFWVWVFDFKGFFDSIRHRLCYAAMKPEAFDRFLADYVVRIIRKYPEHDVKHIQDPVERQRRMDTLNNLEGVGITLGSQISQVMALIVPNQFDHTIKEQCRIHDYERYMDDGIAAHHDKNVLLHTMAVAERMASNVGLHFNGKKTQIIRATKGFTYLKVHYLITASGHIVRKMAHSGIVRRRRTLKKFRSLVDKGKMTLDDVYCSVKSWLGNAEQTDSTRARKSVVQQYKRLFGGYRMEGKAA